MRIISRTPLRDFSQKHPQAKALLDAWYAEVSHAHWKSFTDIKLHYQSADVVAGDRVIFNVGGNKFRLVIKVAYKTGIVYIRFVGTHAEYTRIDAETI
jgi:mRNA interferase HigB